jgi:hypothetical protein
LSKQIDKILPENFATSIKSLLSHKENHKGTIGDYGFSVQEAWEFYKLSLKFDFRKVTGAEPIPGEVAPPLIMCHLESELIAHLVSFYNDIYLEKGVIFYSGKQNQTEPNQIHVNSLIIKGKVLKLGGEVFSSVGCKSDLSANIIAQFLTENKEVVYYPGVVNYYFKHSVNLPWGITEHTLCYISWFKSHKERDWFYIGSELQENTYKKMYNVELWDS